MSKKFLVPIDMNGLEIQNFLAHNLATAPTGVGGRIYFNTADKKLYYYNGTAWVGLTADTKYTGTAPITVSGTAISHANSGVTAASKGDTANQTPAFGGTFKVPSGTVNATGHLTAFADHTVKIPSTEATQTTAGLMSAGDKTKVDNLTYDGVSALYHKEESTYTTTGTSTTTIPVGIDGFGTHDMLFVDINGLDLVEGTDYTISGTNIVLTTPITSAGAVVHFVALRAMTLTSSDIDDFASKTFSKIKVGSTTVEADSSSDTLELVAGSTNVTITADATNDKITIDATGAVSGVKGSAESSYRTGQVNLTAANVGAIATSAKGAASGVAPLNASKKIDNTYLNLDTTVASGGANAVTGGAVYTYVSDAIAAADAMIFKGTIGTGGTVTALPTTYKTGWTYRVITAGTYAGNACEVGDLIIALVDRSGSGNVNADWTVAQTNIDGAITSLSNGTGISVTGSGSSRTIGLASGVATAASKGDTSNQTPGFGSTFKALSATVDTYGRITALADHTVKIPNAAATTSAAGLMSAADKTKLDGIADNANNYTHPTYTARTGKPTANATPGFGSTFTVSQITSDSTGHVTGATDRTVKIPDTVASASAAGLMSAAMFSKLDGTSKIRSYTEDIVPGAKQASISKTDIMAYWAYDASTGEEVVVDVAKSTDKTTFSIAAAYSNTITIRALVLES